MLTADRRAASARTVAASAWVCWLAAISCPRPTRAEATLNRRSAIITEARACSAFAR